MVHDAIAYAPYVSFRFLNLTAVGVLSLLAKFIVEQIGKDITILFLPLTIMPNLVRVNTEFASTQYFIIIFNKLWT